MKTRLTISCVCVTHGRGHLVNQALESFIRQDTDGFTTEFLVYSDCPEQIIECKIPNVIVINTDPIPDLSLKFNKAIESASGEYIAWWEDDDISLPFRLKHSLERIRRSDKCYYKQDRCWFMNSDKLQIERNLFFGNSMFKRSSYIESGGAVEGKPADLSAHESMISSCGLCLEEPSPEEIYFVYSWGGSDHHDSGICGTNLDRFKAFRQSSLSSPNFVPGRFVLSPAWKLDYCKLIEDVLKKESEESVS